MRRVFRATPHTSMYIYQKSSCRVSIREQCTRERVLGTVRAHASLEMLNCKKKKKKKAHGKVLLRTWLKIISTISRMRQVNDNQNHYDVVQILQNTLKTKLPINLTDVQTCSRVKAPLTVRRLYAHYCSTKASKRL